jgi:hypothetical protein
MLRLLQEERQTLRTQRCSVYQFAMRDDRLKSWLIMSLNESISCSSMDGRRSTSREIGVPGNGVRARLVVYNGSDGNIWVSWSLLTEEYLFF